MRDGRPHRDGGQRAPRAAGPETLSHEDIVARSPCAAAGHHRPRLHVPTPVVSRSLRALQALMKSKAPAVWDEAELMEVSMLSGRGTADAERLGVHPRRMADVLGVPAAAAA